MCGLQDNEIGLTNAYHRISHLALAFGAEKTLFDKITKDFEFFKGNATVQIVFLKHSAS